MIKIILKDIQVYLKSKGFKPKLDKKFDIISLDNYCTIVIEKEEKIIGVSFACGFDATVAAIVTKNVVTCCLGKYEGYEVDVLEPYLNLLDKDGRVTNVLFGDDAIATYNKFLLMKEENSSKQMGNSYEL